VPGSSNDERGGKTVDDQPLEELSESECWTLLRSVAVGRLATPNAHGGVDVFPVNHVIDQGSIVFRTALGSKLTNALDATEVAFEADNASPNLREHAERLDDPWSVVIHGTAELITQHTELFDSFELKLQPWHVSNKPYFVRLVPTAVSGRRFHAEPS
jgi:nitroimidazol reductase NimA-like FMN-containing flavoprotein (pyridoxamine 5'-phosphate oxidase superfamily)